MDAVVPGAGFLYRVPAGAKLLAHYPVSVIADGLALNMTVIGYLGQLHFGLIAGRERVPDVVIHGDVDEMIAVAEGERVVSVAWLTEEAEADNGLPESGASESGAAESGDGAAV